MSKKHLLPQANEEFLQRLGLTDIDTKVYIATLDGGLVSLGEIQQLTEIKDLGHILESVRDLIDVGLVKKAQGTMRRYYATLPFFRETLSVEREFKFALEAMIKSLNLAKEQTTKDRERIMNVKFPDLVDNLLDRYYQEILAPILKDLETLRDELKSNALPFIKEINASHDQYQEKVKQLIKPLDEFAQLLNQKFDLAVAKEGGKLDDYITSRRQNRLVSLKKAHTSISDHLQKIKSQITALVDSLKTANTSLQQQLPTVEGAVSDLSTKSSSFETSAQAINDAKKELQAELVVAREQVKRAVTSPDPSTRIDEIFSNLNNKISPIDFSSDELVGILDQSHSTMQSAHTSMKEVVAAINQQIQQVEDNLLTTFDTLKNAMTGVFNELNETDEEKLIEFKDQLQTEIKLLGDSIRNEGEQLRTKLSDQKEELLAQLEKTQVQHQGRLASLYDRPKDIINPFLDIWVDEVAKVIDDFKSQSDTALTDILNPIVKLEEGTFSILTERIGFVKTMIEGRSNDLQQVLIHAQEFDFTKSADTSVAVGLPAIYASLTDLLLRTKTSVTLVTPNLDLELVEIARTLKSSIRVTFVTDIDPEKDARLVKKIDDMGRINLRYYPDRDLYACIRDSEEIVFGYIREGEQTVGLRSSTPSIVELLGDRLNETVIRNSKTL